MVGRVSAAAAVVDDAGRLLIVRQNYGERRYSLPGGGMERDEAPDEAAVRETFEETGLRVRPDYVVGVYRLDSGYVIYVFRCSQAGAVRAQGANDEIAEVVWSDIDAIPTPVTNTLDYALPDIVKGERGVVREGLPHR